MSKVRASLPAHAARAEFFKIHDSSHQAILVTGETGCGKTTQIPQFILEENPTAKIIVAQPRRLAATGVAMRVAAERGESACGSGSVGYVVRGDSAVGAATRLLFCTTGVLLRQLQNEDALGSLTHIVIDEVHERNLDTDVLLAVLKDELKRNKRLKVVLMSATMDADRFAAYWGKNTPRMHIPGYTHPVQDFFLKDVLEFTGYIPPRGTKVITRDDDGDYSSASAPGTVPMADRVARVDDVNTDYFLVASLVHALVSSKTHVGDDGSILVFLPGVEEIKRCEQAVVQSCRLLSSRMKIFQLHGSLRPAEQKLVFQAYPGCTKVVISTNVAETSITIPDCVVVIDGCREKQSGFDPANRMPMLLEQFASQDSLRQRRGRAGRVRPGVCYKLITKKRHASLREHGVPEIARCAIDSTVLNLKYLGLDTRLFLSTMLDPPSPTAVASAVSALRGLGAVEEHEREGLTPLGTILAQIPAPPPVAKLLTMGCVLNCRDAGLTIAAGMSVGRSPFMKVMLAWKRKPRKSRYKGDDEDRIGGIEEEEEDEEEDFEEVKKKRVLENREKLRKTVGHTDLGLLAAAYSKWADAQGAGEKRQVCEMYGLAPEGMREFKQLTNQFDGALRGAGLGATPRSNENADQWRITRAMVVSALSPGGLVRVERASAKYDDTQGGAVERDGQAKELKFFVKAGQEDAANHRNGQMRVFVHPSSAMFHTGNYSCPWLVFFSLATTSKAFLRDVTEATGYSMLLFGGKLEVRAAEGQLVVAGVARFSAPPRIGVLVGGIRERLDDLLWRKVMEPQKDMEDLDGGGVMQLIKRLLISDGLG